MTDTATVLPATGAPAMNLAARLIGVLFSPRAAYAAIAAHPRGWGALAVSIGLIVATQYAFLSTDTGRELAIEQQVRGMEAFGMTVTDEAYDQIAANIEQRGYIGLISTAVVVPIVNALFAGILMAVFTMLMGGSGTFKQVFALVAHAGFVTTIGALFTTPLSIASGRMAGADLGIFVPMLEETNFFAVFLGAINLFYVWWFVSLAIGLGVLYRRRTGPIAIALLSLYVVGALVWAAFRSGS